MKGQAYDTIQCCFLVLNWLKEFIGARIWFDQFYMRWFITCFGWDGSMIYILRKSVNKVGGERLMWTNVSYLSLKKTVQNTSRLHLSICLKIISCLKYVQNENFKFMAG